MQAEGIRKGDRFDRIHPTRGRVVGGWTATGDAVVAYDTDYKRNRVFVPVRLHSGEETANVYEIGEQVDLTFGV